MYRYVVYRVFSSRTLMGARSWEVLRTLQFQQTHLRRIQAVEYDKWVDRCFGRLPDFLRSG
ncbi:MAG: hypothetical protein HC780_27425 [Leptolyngbyaceae cyanobacterium CSU_1_3]|nr:hypothetical protein [Leptolyngbyaceae cyanobacterium CSU_1_3]